MKLFGYLAIFLSTFAVMDAVAQMISLLHVALTFNIEQPTTGSPMQTTPAVALGRSSLISMTTKVS